MVRLDAEKRKLYWQPRVWERRMGRIWLPSIMASLIFFILGLYWVFFRTPPDYHQGEVFKILYVHVPSAWLALLLYAFMGFLSLVYLVTKAPVVALLSKSVAFVGVTMTTICLLTGALWGKPTWGTYWVWDARLTSMALLFFLYVGYIFLGRAFSRPEVGWKMASFIGFIGLLNLPVIKWSVEWWYTLHQPATFFKLSGTSADQAMIPALVIIFSALSLYTLSLVALLYLLCYRSVTFSNNYRFRF